MRIVDAQMKDMDKQMGALDDFVAKARSQNGQFHDAHLDSLKGMATNVRQSYSITREHLGGYGERINQLQNDTSQHKTDLLESTVPLSNEVRKPLSELRSNIQARPLKEYAPTGITPLKRRYEYPSTLPQTEAHEMILSRLRNSKQLKALPFGGEDNISPLKSSSLKTSPAKGFVYNDADAELDVSAEDEVGATEPSAPTTSGTLSNTGLREVDANVVARPPAPDEDEPISSSSPIIEAPEPSAKVRTDEDHGADVDGDARPSKRHCSTAAFAESKLPHKGRKTAGVVQGRENVPPVTSAKGASSRGRRLRARPSTSVD